MFVRMYFVLGLGSSGRMARFQVVGFQQSCAVAPNTKAEDYLPNVSPVWSKESFQAEG
jgi:hypothetical protein